MEIFDTYEDAYEYLETIAIGEGYSYDIIDEHCIVKNGLICICYEDKEHTKDVEYILVEYKL